MFSTLLARGGTKLHHEITNSLDPVDGYTMDLGETYHRGG